MKSTTKTGQFRYKTDTSRISNNNEQPINSKVSTSRANILSSRKIGLKSHSSNGTYKKDMINDEILHNNSIILTKANTKNL